jgi:ribosomal protein S24E
MEIKKEFENKLLKRKELVIEMESDSSTISRKKAKEMIAKKLKVEENLIIVKKIKSKLGSLKVEIEVNVYETEDALKKFSREYLIKRNVFEQNKEEAEA